MIRFACPSCYHTFEVSDRKIGTKFNCDACGKRLQVPAPPAASAAEPRRAPVSTALAKAFVEHQAALDSPPSAPPAPPHRTSRSLPVRLFIATAVGVSALLVGGGIVLLVLASRAPKPQGASRAAPTGPGAPDTSSTAVRAQAVLRNCCYRCHGENGAAEGGFNFVLDRDKLVARKKVAPGDSAHSKLYHRVAEGEMPPAGETPRPAAEDVALVRQWIDEGAVGFSPPSPGGSFLPDDQLVALLHDDLLTVPERDRKFIRYFTLTDLANAHLSDDELQTYRHTLAKLVNSLSWNKDVVAPRPVGTGAAALRIDIRDYSWSDRLWSDVLALYPYGVLLNSPEAKDLYDAAGGCLSYVRADWFIATASRPPLYHELLQLPENERKLEDQLHIDVAEDIRQERVARAGFNGSGVSRNNRIIERHESPYGSLWHSYDFADSEGAHNLFSHPLGPRDDAAVPDASGGEIIFNLPNGLHAFMLVDGKGRRLDKASLAIVSDARRPDRAVENGVSCMNCHARGVIAKADQVRAHVEQNANAFPQGESDTVMALYPPPDRMRALFAEDNERFRRAVEKTGSQLTKTEPIASVVEQYERELDMTTAAAELGLSPAGLAEQLDRFAPLARTLGPLRVSGGSVQREVWLAAFPDLVRDLDRGTFLTPQRLRR